MALRMAGFRLRLMQRPVAIDQALWPAKPKHRAPVQDGRFLTGRGLSLNSASRRNTTQFVDPQPELSSPGKDDR
jgi:hypothetical protein